MTTETFATLSILLICWIALMILDAAVCGLLYAIFGTSFRKAFLYGLISLFIPPLCFAYGSLIERNRVQVNEVEISSAEVPEGFDGYRIVHISDIHARSFQKRRKVLEKMAARINGLDADLIAFTGDIITMDSSELDSLSHILKGLEAKDGVMSVLGNHDYCIYAHPEAADDDVSKVIEKEKAMGWNVLIDENRRITRGKDTIAVIGVENTSPSRHFPSKGDLVKASEGTEGLFRILLSHDPMHWDMEVLGKDYPLTLSGHTHAMQFALGKWCPSKYMFRQYRGLYTVNSQHLYVNIGLGETIFPARIGAVPEITLITLKRGS